MGGRPGLLKKNSPIPIPISIRLTKRTNVDRKKERKQSPAEREMRLLPYVDLMCTKTKWRVWTGERDVCTIKVLECDRTSVSGEAKIAPDPCPKSVWSVYACYSLPPANHSSGWTLDPAPAGKPSDLVAHTFASIVAYSYTTARTHSHIYLCKATNILHQYTHSWKRRRFFRESGKRMSPR